MQGICGLRWQANTARGLNSQRHSHQTLQITNPNGKTLLSTDPARCRQAVALGGFFTGVVPAVCPDLHIVNVDGVNITGLQTPFLSPPQLPHRKRDDFADFSLPNLIRASPGDMLLPVAPLAVFFLIKVRSKELMH